MSAEHPPGRRCSGVKGAWGALFLALLPQDPHRGLHCELPGQGQTPVPAVMLIWTTPQVHPTIPSSATCGFHVRLLSQPLSSFSWFVCVSVLWPNVYQYAAHTKFLIVISWSNSIAWIGKNIYLPMPFDVLQLFQSFPFSSLYVFAFVLFGLWSVSIILFCFSIKHFHFCISVLVHFSWVSFPSPPIMSANGCERRMTVCSPSINTIWGCCFSRGIFLAVSWCTCTNP